jgi:hypothetical protein
METSNAVVVPVIDEFVGALMADPNQTGHGLFDPYIAGEARYAPVTREIVAGAVDAAVDAARDVLREAREPMGMRKEAELARAQTLMRYAFEWGADPQGDFQDAVCDRLIAEVVELRKAWYADAPVATAIVLMQVIDPEQDDGVVWSADQYPCLLRWQVTPEQLVALQAAFHEAMFHRADDATIAAALTVDDRKACDIDMSVEYVAPQVAGPGTVDLASMAGADAERSAGRVELRLAWNDHVYFWASHAGVEVESMGFSLQKMRRALDEGGGHPVVLLFSGDLVTEVENTLPDASRDDVVARLEGLGWVAGDNWTAAQVKAVPPEEALRAAGHCGPQP